MLAALIKKQWFGWAFCALTTALAGMVLILYAPGQILQQLSYDLPYALRKPVALTSVVVVYVDPNSLKLLEQTGWPPDRRIYANLVRRLQTAGARMILFDIHFRASKPAEDGEFAAALREHGNVVLGGLFDLTRQQGVETVGIVMGQATPPTPLLRTNARAWGLLALRPLDYSFAARRIFKGINEMDSLVWTAAKLENAAAIRDPAVAGRELWLNFYGPARSLNAVSLHQALDPQGVPAGFFRDAVVLVGADPSLSPQTGERDTFPTPYSRVTSGADATYMPGVEMHATAYANLARGEWLERISTLKQVGMAIAWALALSFGLHRLTPKRAILLALGAGAGLTAVSLYLQLYLNLWWTWLAPAVVQTALALGVTIACRYAIESRQRQQLREAFAAYVTPEVMEQVISRGLDLAPGGHEALVTVMFSDVQSFTDMSEKVTPKELSQILTQYFDEATNCVLAQQGTVTKYIGDSVMAVWGAPVPRADHAARAVKAALGIGQLGQKTYFGHRLLTRIGVNTGLALVGNLGSKFRFDYTVIGANVNYASRLEGLNKHLGTTLLVSDSTRQLLDEGFQTRCLGKFTLRGTSAALPVHEVLAWQEPPSPRPSWCAVFEQAVAACEKREFELARQLFQQVEQLRGGSDGPSRFYLDYLAGRDDAPANGEWTGAIVMTEK